MVDWKSFLIGVTVGAVAAFFSGVFGAAGKDFYTWVMQKISPPEPSPIKVKGSFRPRESPEGRFAWISEHEVSEKLAEGYRFYIGPEDGAKRYQIPNESSGMRDRAFFMYRPNDDP